MLFYLVLLDPFLLGLLAEHEDGRDIHNFIKLAEKLKKRKVGCKMADNDQRDPRQGRRQGKPQADKFIDKLHDDT